MVARTEKTIQDGKELSANNTRMVAEIVEFVDKQRNSTEEILRNLLRISEMVETNAAAAQENSAISTQLGECARILMETINQFNLK